jgi:fucose permease
MSVFGYGMGLGLTIPAANLYISWSAGERSVAALSVLNFAWSAGAVFCPLVVILTERKAGLRGVAILLGGITALCAVLVGMSRGLRVSGEGSPLRRGLGDWIGLLRRWRVIALALLFFLYVGTENAVGGWVASHAKRASTVTDSLWVLAPSVFWAALLVGRGTAPAAWRYLGEEKLAKVTLAMATLGALLIFVSGSPAGIRISAGIAGLGLAPVFPILVARLTKTLGDDSKWAGGLMFGCAGVGGAVLPWLVGAVSAGSGSLRAGLGVPVLSCALMLLLSTGWQRKEMRLGEMKE